MRRLFLYIVSILVFFVIGIILANFIIMPSFVRMGKEISVPNVCNLPLDTAIQVLKRQNLQGVVTERRYDQIIEEGKIIIQEPLPASKVKKGRIINLSVSLGPETINVPFLLDVDFEKGKLIIERLGLVVEGIDSSFSDSILKGRIIKTIPDFETEVKKGDGIRVVISQGIVLRMPDLVGMKLAQAQQLLKNKGLIIRELKEVEASGTKGEIIIQNPEPGQIVNPGDSVNLMVIK